MINGQIYTCQEVIQTACIVISLETAGKTPPAFKGLRWSFMLWQTEPHLKPSILQLFFKYWRLKLNQMNLNH